jgi:MFS family permease
MFGTTFLIPLYYQQIKGSSPLYAGLLISLQGVGSLLTRWVGKPVDIMGPKPVILIGMALGVIGTLPFTQADLHTNGILLGISLIIRGAGLSAANIAISTSSYIGIRQNEVPDATSAFRVLQQLGNTFGVAIIAIILHSLLIGNDIQKQFAAFDNTFRWTLGFTLIAFLFALLLPGHSQIKELKKV